MLSVASRPTTGRARPNRGTLAKAPDLLHATVRVDSRGSILLPLLFHWQLINPLWPDARPWDTWILVALAAITVWLKRATMLTGAAAVTEVVPRRADGASP